MISFAINRGNIKSTDLENVSLEGFKELATLLTVPVITSDKLNAGYFLRGTGTKRSDKTVDDVASLLILDGDGMPETTKPRGSDTGAACVKLTPNDDSQGHQFANS
jgi:hypothetical protein